MNICCFKYLGVTCLITKGFTAIILGAKTSTELSNFCNMFSTIFCCSFHGLRIVSATAVFLLEAYINNWSLFTRILQEKNYGSFHVEIFTPAAKLFLVEFPRLHVNIFHTSKVVVTGLRHITYENLSLVQDKINFICREIREDIFKDVSSSIYKKCNLIRFFIFSSFFEKITEIKHRFLACIFFLLKQKK